VEYPQLRRWEERWFGDGCWSSGDVRRRGVGQTLSVPQVPVKWWSGCSCRAGEGWLATPLQQAKGLKWGRESEEE